MALLWSAPDDVRSRWVSDSPLTVDDAALNVLLEDAEDLVLSEFPDISERIPSPIPVLRVKRVIARVVIRHLKNPDGVRVQMETAGPFSDQRTFSGDSPGALYLTDQDRSDLSPSVAPGKAFQIDMTPKANLSLVSPADLFQKW